MKINRPVGTRSDTADSRVKLLTLCFFFSLGAVIAYLLHGFVGASDDSMLHRYIQAYMQSVSENPDCMPGILSVLDSFFRYPLTIYFLGFTATGILLVPTILVLQGMSLTFSILCFSSALGRGGLLLALVAFGVRSAFVLPTTMLVAGHSVSRAAKLLEQPKRRNERKTQSKGETLYLLYCVTILLAGVAVELLLVPELLQSALSAIL